MRDSADQALKLNHEQARNRFQRDLLRAISESSPDANEQLKTLRLQPSDDNDYRVSRDSLPLFVKAERFRADVRAFNDAMAGYAAMLQRLGAAGELSDEEFTSLATELNANARSAFRAVKADPPDAERTAILSTAAVALLRQYLRSESRAELAAAVKRNQDTIGEWSQVGTDAVDVAVFHLWQEYGELSQEHFRAIAGRENVAASLTSLIGLNEATLDRLEALAALRDAYSSLPAAHLDLATAINDPEFSPVHIQRLLERAKFLKQVAAKAEADAGQGAP